MSELSEKEEFFVSELLKWHKTHRRVFPWRVNKTPYKVFVAEFFLQRTPAERVAKVYEKFLEEYPDIEKLARADPEKLARDYHELGLTKRFKWLVESANMIKNKHECKVPKDYELLIELPGIGDYTASAILCFAYGEKIEIVDTNVIRVLKKVFGLSNVNVLNVKKIAKILVPSNCTDFNEAILDFAANVCKKKAECDRCVIKTLCYCVK